jgi:hypothetical protein
MGESMYFIRKDNVFFLIRKVDKTEMKELFLDLPSGFDVLLVSNPPPIFDQEDQRRTTPLLLFHNIFRFI